MIQLYITINVPDLLGHDTAAVDVRINNIRYSYSTELTSLLRQHQQILSK